MTFSDFFTSDNLERKGRFVDETVSINPQRMPNDAEKPRIDSDDIYPGGAM